jgi:hypothetical protein
MGGAARGRGHQQVGLCSAQVSRLVNESELGWWFVPQGIKKSISNYSFPYTYKRKNK